MASSPVVTTANDFVERQLDDRIEAIEVAFQGHAVAYSGPLLQGVDDLFRDVVEKRHATGVKNDRLIVLLTTGGGFIEVVQRIVGVMRRHYKLVDFVVPNYAYSAGTVLVMSGDAIHMDYYSRLGPIDPQVESRDGRWVPALGYLERYDRLIAKATAGEITTAEVQLLIEAFDQAELYSYEHARQLSIALLKQWLVKYKFKNWSVTRTKKKRVTKSLKITRAAAIAKQLNNTEKWHSHGHGIAMEVLEKDINLQVDDFGSTEVKRVAVRSYDGLLADYMRKMQFGGVFHISGMFMPFMRSP